MNRIFVGIWSHIAATEAKKYGAINYVFPMPSPSGVIPDEASWSLNPNASYVYYCDNETIQGPVFYRIKKLENEKACSRY